MAETAFRIATVSSAADLAAVASLFEAYAAALEVDLAYQGFSAELAGLPGQYAPPRGALLLARDAAGVAIGCAALRPMSEAGWCEMKRLYVSPTGRGVGLGRALAQAVIDEAVWRGYREIRLDTLPGMGAGLALYRTLGFTAVPPYYDTAPAGTVFLGRSLQS